PILAAAAAAVVIVVGIIVLVGGGAAPQSDQARQTEPRVLPPPSQTNQQEPATPRGDVTVGVLNGTSVPGLAKRVAEQIAGSGYDVPDDLVANAVEQNRSATVVMYAEGAREEAEDVAKVIDVGSDALDVMDDSTRTLTQGRARVVVTVGADQSQQ
ncbi:MAG TPA: LytR C-terminal domain-containing protein, partial [Solirubrobacteraceae bacterium]|nr:LytR C-terminal domain-containing protein [Solirubrobacteraceae bacterium]